MQPTQKPQYVTKTEKYDVSVMETLLENASKQGIFYAKGQHMERCREWTSRTTSALR